MIFSGTYTKSIYYYGVQNGYQTVVNIEKPKIVTYGPFIETDEGQGLTLYPRPEVYRHLIYLGTFLGIGLTKVYIFFLYRCKVNKGP